MKAFYLVKNGKSETAFELKELPKINLNAGEIRIKVNAFGLNFADIMARLGLYRDAPPMPCVLGYEVTGKITEVASDVKNFKIGDRVAAFTFFGGYAEEVVSPANAAAIITDKISDGEALALVTQYCTAYFCAEEAVTLHEGDHVLIQAAAGGVGTALVQLAKRKKCIIYGTAGSNDKLEYLKKLGVDFPINYRTQDFYEVIKKLRGDKGIDVVFDSIGGDAFKKGFKLLGSGGRILGFGAAEAAGGVKIISMLKLAMGFGIFSPIELLTNSKSIIGVNMLKIGKDRPHILKHCLEEIIKLSEKGIINPTVGKMFSFKELPNAHEYLESRASIGKVGVYWN